MPVIAGRDHENIDVAVIEDATKVSDCFHLVVSSRQRLGRSLCALVIHITDHRDLDVLQSVKALGKCPAPTAHPHHPDHKFLVGSVRFGSTHLSQASDACRGGLLR